MSTHASTQNDGGRRPNRRCNPKKGKGVGSGGDGGSGGKGDDQSRFEGEGLMFRAKLIGSQAVPEARGDRMCQDTMTRLKMAVRACGKHKQRVQLTVSLQGIKIRDEKTGEMVFHHPVHHISFISLDANDARAFGYVCMTQVGCHRFIAIKTEKAASQLVVALSDLFQIVLEMKQHELRIAQQEKRQQLQAWTPHSDFSNRGEVQELMCSPQCASSGNPTVPETAPVMDDLLDLHSELDCWQEGIQHMDTTIATAATLALPDPFDMPFVSGPGQQHFYPGSRACVSEPSIPVGLPPPLLPPPPLVARASLQSSAFGGQAQQQQKYRAMQPPRTLPFVTLPQATASLPPTHMPYFFSDLDPLAEGNSGKRSSGFGELKSPSRTPAELPKPTSGWQTFEEEEEDDGPPPPAFPPPPPPLNAQDEGFCSGSNASSMTPSLLRPATAATTAAAFSSDRNFFSRSRGQDPFAD